MRAGAEGTSANVRRLRARSSACCTQRHQQCATWCTRATAATTPHPSPTSKNSLAELRALLPPSSQLSPPAQMSPSSQPSLSVPLLSVLSRPTIPCEVMLALALALNACKSPWSPGPLVAGASPPPSPKAAAVAALAVAALGRLRRPYTSAAEGTKGGSW